MQMDTAAHGGDHVAHGEDTAHGEDVQTSGGMHGCCGGQEDAEHCLCNGAHHAPAPSHSVPQWQFSVVGLAPAVHPPTLVAFEGDTVAYQVDAPAQEWRYARPPPLPIYLQHCILLM